MVVDNTIRDLLYQLENRLLQPEIRHSPAELDNLLADEFIEFASSGQAFDKKQIIAALSTEPSCRISISDFQTVPLAPDTVLATYRATILQDDDPPRHSLRSSIWKLEKESWRMVFHQGTPMPAD